MAPSDRTPESAPGTAPSSSGPGESRLRARLRILTSSRVFSELPQQELDRLAATSTYRRLRSDEALTTHGERVTSLVVIGQGLLKIVLPTPETGSDFLVGIVTPGEVIGEIGVFEGTPRVGSHIAIEESEIVLISREDLLSLIGRQPQVAIRLLAELSTKLRFALELGLGMHSLDLPARFYRRLLYFHRNNPGSNADGLRIEHGLSQRDLATSIGATREALNRLMKGWKESGLIDYGRGFVVITNAQGLEDMLPPSARLGSLLDGGGG